MSGLITEWEKIQTSEGFESSSTFITSKSEFLKFFTEFNTNLSLFDGV